MFVKRAIELNIFETDYYCWSDIGMIRHDYYIKYITNFPKVHNHIKSDKMYMLNIQYMFNETDSKYSELATDIYRFINVIGAGVFFGHKDVFQKWITKYYETLDDFVKKDIFTGKEQNVMACVYVKNREIIELIRAKNCPLNDEWFYLLYYFC
jgi:hypothetical protein